MRAANRRSVVRAQRKRAIIAVVVALVVLIAALAILLIWKNRSAQPVEVVPVENVYTTYWGDSLTLDGNITSGKAQNVSLKSGLVQSIDVAEGQSVTAGTVLMTYDTTALQLTLQSDVANIAVIESKLEMAKDHLSTYKTLKPAESAPAPTEVFVPGNAEAPETLDTVLPDSQPVGGDGTAENPLQFACNQLTVVPAETLQWLATTGLSATFQIYDGIALLCAWTVDGSTLSGELSDWTLVSGITLNGDGTAVVDFSVPHYGTLSTFVPNYDDGSYSYFVDNYSVDSKGNYLYSKAELAQMISETQQEIASLELDLRQANLTYEQDKLVSETGQVTAAIDGTVSFVGDPAALSEGETVITVKGEENYTLTAYIGELNMSKVAVGDTLEAYCYETSNSITATITEIGDTAAEGSYGWGNENPNSSYYPITAVVDDPDVQLSIGEWCEVTIPNKDDESENSGIYLPIYCVRDDASGSYIMVADENDKLVKRYVGTGKTVWGSMIEIKSGLSITDRIAFPYGKDVKEGAPVQDADYFSTGSSVYY